MYPFTIFPAKGNEEASTAQGIIKITFVTDRGLTAKRIATQTRLYIYAIRD